MGQPKHAAGRSLAVRRKTSDRYTDPYCGSTPCVRFFGAQSRAWPAPTRRAAIPRGYRPTLWEHAMRAILSALNRGHGPLPQGPLPQGPLPQGPLPQDPLPQDPLPQDPLPQRARPSRGVTDPFCGSTPCVRFFRPSIAGMARSHMARSHKARGHPEGLQTHPVGARHACDSLAPNRGRGPLPQAARPSRGIPDSFCGSTPCVRFFGAQSRAWPAPTRPAPTSRAPIPKVSRLILWEHAMRAITGALAAASARKSHAAGPGRRSARRGPAAGCRRI